MVLDLVPSSPSPLRVGPPGDIPIPLRSIGCLPVVASLLPPGTAADAAFGPSGLKSLTARDVGGRSPTKSRRRRKIALSHTVATGLQAWKGKLISGRFDAIGPKYLQGRNMNMLLSKFSAPGYLTPVRTGLAP